MNVEILYITCGRLEYTKKSLPSVVENAGMDFSLCIYDNGSDDGTKEFLSDFVKQYKNKIEINFLNENKGISHVTNMFWEKSTAKIIGKIDNDMLMPKNWLRILYSAFISAKDIHILGPCTVFPEDVDEELARKRARNVNGVMLLQEEYIGGCYIADGNLLRKNRVKINPQQYTSGWPELQVDLFSSGALIGILYPFVFVEHMDDPRSQHCLRFKEYFEYSNKLYKQIHNVELDKEKFVHDIKEYGQSLSAGTAMLHCAVRELENIKSSRAWRVLSSIRKFKKYL